MITVGSAPPAPIVICLRCYSDGEVRNDAERKGWATLTLYWSGLRDAKLGLDAELCPRCAAAFRRFLLNVPLVDEPQEGR